MLTCLRWNKNLNDTVIELMSLYKSFHIHNNFLSDVVYHGLTIMLLNAMLLKLKYRHHSTHTSLFYQGQFPIR